MKGQASDATETVAGQAKSSTDRVKRQSKGSTEAVKEEAKGATGEAKAKAKRAASTAKQPGAGSTRPGGVTRASVRGAVTVPRSSRVATPSGVRSR